MLANRDAVMTEQWLDLGSRLALGDVRNLMVRSRA
jgi:hypothetical protein